MAHLDMPINLLSDWDHHQDTWLSFGQVEDGVRAQFIIDHIPGFSKKPQSAILKWFQEAWLAFCANNDNDNDNDNDFVVLELVAHKEVMDYLGTMEYRYATDQYQIREAIWNKITHEMPEIQDDDKICCVFQHWFRLCRCRAEHLGFSDDRTKAEGPVTAFVCVTCGAGSQEQAKQLKCCAACHKVMYCNRDCQKKDWQVHKSSCRSLKNTF
jgi:hypothetical protein